MKVRIALILFAIPIFLACHNNNDKKHSEAIGSEPEITSPPVDTIFQKIDTNGKTIAERFPVPESYERLELDENSFGYYLRNLPLKPNGAKVYAYDGTLIENEGDFSAVIDIDVGKRDLQQCADAVMRLRAEYLYKQKRYDEIHFDFLSDSKPRYYTNYADGNYSYQKFRKYMDYIFSYANTTSLSAELKPTTSESIKPGDVFIEAGRPIGHAVIVVDVAVNPETNDRIFMLAQSFMPAQSIHVLENFNNNELSPWYKNDFGDILYTPNWHFESQMLKTFEDE
jgi:hypothetical protein